MIDRTKALIAGAVVIVAVLLVGSIGYIAGRASTEDESPTPTPPASGDGLPEGPTRLTGGVPFGFARTEAGARSAAAAWLPWFLSSPSGEWPDGLADVLADGVEFPDNEMLTTRFQFAPIAVRSDMESDSRAEVTLLGPILEGNLGDPLTGEFWSVPVSLEWSDSAADWRISALPTAAAGDYVLDGPIDASDLEGFDAIRPSGIIDGSPIVEAVPGE